MFSIKAYKHITIASYNEWSEVNSLLSTTPRGGMNYSVFFVETEVIRLLSWFLGILSQASRNLLIWFHPWTLELTISSLPIHCNLALVPMFLNGPWLLKHYRYRVNFWLADFPRACLFIYQLKFFSSQLIYVFELYKFFHRSSLLIPTFFFVQTSCT